MKLFESACIGTMVLKNRLVAAAMNSRLAQPGGYVSQRIVDHYARRAQGGAALVIVADGGVDPFHVNSHIQLRICDDSFIPGLALLAQGIKDNGAKAAIQLQHAGWQTGPSIGLAQAVGPTALRSRNRGQPTRALTVTEIKEVVRRFGWGARRAKEAGWDAVEIHGAHGYLLSVFLSPLTNWRQDDYGGDVQHRARLALEIVAAIRKEVGRDYPVIFRISADDFAEGGLKLNESRPVCRWLEEAGVDCISVSGGADGFGAETQPCMLLPRGIMVPLAAAIKAEVSVPVIAVGRIDTPALAERILQQGKADLIAMGRPLLADPDLPRKALEGREREIRKCIYCLSCMRDPPPEGLPIMCLVNPEAGREGETEGSAPKVKNVLVIGAGPAGLEAARVARLRGHEVTVWEEAHTLGGRWSWLIRGFITEREKVLRTLRVKLELGRPVTAQAVAAVQPDVVLVTPRAVPPPIPPLLPIPVGGAENVVWADDVLDGRQQIKGKVVVIGTGNVGCEVAWFLSRQEVAVTLVGGEDRAGKGIYIHTAEVVVPQLSKRGVQFRTGVRVMGIQDGRVLYQDSQGHGCVLGGDAFVVAEPAQPSTELAAELLNLGFEVHLLPYCSEPGWTPRAVRIGASIARQV